MWRRERGPGAQHQAASAEAVLRIKEFLPLAMLTTEGSAYCVNLSIGHEFTFEGDECALHHLTLLLAFPSNAQICHTLFDGVATPLCRSTARELVGVLD